MILLQKGGNDIGALAFSAQTISMLLAGEPESKCLVRDEIFVDN